MDIAVQTGATKAGSGVTLVSLSFTSKQKENILLLLHVLGSEHDAKVLEEEGIAIIQHSLIDTEGDAWQRLDGTLKEFNGLIKGLLVSQTVQDVHAVVAIMEPDGTLHVSQAGRGEGYLVRAGMATQITEYTRGKPVSAFIHISSGPLEGQDSIVFSTQRLLRALTPAQVAQFSQRGGQAIDDIVDRLNAEKEMAAVAILHFRGGAAAVESTSRTLSLPSRRASGRRVSKLAIPSLATLSQKLRPFLSTVSRKGAKHLSSTSKVVAKVREGTGKFLADLKHPQRKRRAHFLLLAGAVAVFLVVWLFVNVFATSQRTKTKAVLSTLMQQINDDLKMADNQRLAGDVDKANAILQRADKQAKQIMDNESGLFRSEALDLLDRIRAKREEINYVVRVSPRVLVNLGAKNASIAAEGLVGVADGEFIVFDREQAYHVLLNSVDDPRKLADGELIVDGVSFPRYKTQVFMTAGSSVIELQGNQPQSMKTEDPSGWVKGKDLETYLRYLYMLSADNRIFKYERLTNRYSAPVQYNVSGDLTGAVDMSIDSSVYVLKEGGAIVKLFRGEAKPFTIRHAPEGFLKDAAKIFKSPDSNFYFLDPVKSRVIVTTDGGPNGESSYVKQYVLEGEHVGKLKDLFVDIEESHLFVLDEKRVYVIDIAK